MTDLNKQHWDYYARNTQRDNDLWPGDEWGNANVWDSVFKTLFVPSGVADWEKAVEIGAGSGKYTLRVLAAARNAHVLAADISEGYQSVFRERMTAEGLAERTTPRVIEPHSGSLRRHIETMGWTGQLDAVYSIDAMVHVDLQYIIAYLITAAAALKPGGKLIMTFSDATSDAGFAKLIKDTPQMFARADQHTAKFEWMSPDIVSNLMPRLNFDIDILDTSSRDILTVATLRTPVTSGDLLAAIR